MYNIWHSISQLSSEARTKWLPRPLDRFKAKEAMTSTLGEQHNTWLMGPSGTRPGLKPSSASIAPTGQV